MSAGYTSQQILLAQTTDGRSFTGLLVRRSEKQVVLRDGENREIVLAASKVEQMRPSRREQW